MRPFDEILHQAALPDTTTDAELDDLQKEIVRDVTAVLMLGARPSPEGQPPTPLERAEADLRAVSIMLLRSEATAQHLARLADVPVDADGALYFGCLLHLVQERDGALWWWQFAAGAGSGAAAHCLYLLHLCRGELRDAYHWAHQALILGAHVQRVPRCCCPRLDSHTEALREAVRRLKVDEVDGAVLHHPDQLLADRIEELAAAC
ncbi:hypothetical protein ABZ626_16665 [Streptomyces longispororuber]|uniref:hypothetical protein n=1 Tax=Streptomyces longispororuber TaxID=68230 RepID=UPI0033D878E7